MARVLQTIPTYWYWFIILNFTITNS